MQLISQYYGKPFELVELQGGRIAAKVQPGGQALFTARKATQRPYQKLYVCSPLSAPTADGIEANMRRARQSMLEAAAHYGCRAVVPHAYLPELLDDNRPAERELALSFGKRLLSLCDAVVICGNRISKGMGEEIFYAASLGKPVLLFPYWEVETDFEAGCAPQTRTVTLRSGKSLTEEEMEEVEEIIYRLGDIEDVQTVLDSGIHDDSLLFAPLTDRCISDIAQRKSIYERQKGYSWEDAVDRAVQDWRDEEYARLLETLLDAYIKRSGNQEITLEEFENAPELFRNKGTVKLLANPQDFKIWEAIVPNARTE